MAGFSPWLRVEDAADEAVDRRISRTDVVGETMCHTGCVLSLMAPPLAMTGVVRPVRTEWFAAQSVMSVTTLGLGAGLALWAQRHLAGEWRVGVEAGNSLVTSGLFARVRNPSPRLPAGGRPAA